MTTSSSLRIGSPGLLDSAVALLTASTSGIGAESARQLAQAGARAVIINGRNEETGKNSKPGPVAKCQARNSFSLRVK